MWSRFLSSDQARQCFSAPRNIVDYVWLYGLFLLPFVAYLISVSPSFVGWGVSIVALFVILTGPSLVCWGILLSIAFFTGLHWGLFGFALLVLLVWRVGLPFGLGDEYRDGWEEDDFGTEYGEEWEEDYVFEEPILNEEHRKQLKQLFRRAAQSCHPDKCPEHLKDTAHQLFTQLNAAFQANDIEGVQNISDIVRSGVFRVDRINSQSVASSR